MARKADLNVDVQRQTKVSATLSASYPIQRQAVMLQFFTLFRLGGSLEGPSVSIDNRGAGIYHQNDRFLHILFSLEGKNRTENSRLGSKADNHSLGIHFILTCYSTSV